jgi:hypothetical protein
MERGVLDDQCTTNCPSILLRADFRASPARR